MSITPAPAVHLELDPSDLEIIVVALRQRAIDIRSAAAQVPGSLTPGGSPWRGQPWLEEAIKRGVADIVAEATELEQIAAELASSAPSERSCEHPTCAAERQAVKLSDSSEHPC